jgi:hypothetical protein
MSSGGAGGRKYLPRAKDEIAVIARIAIGLAITILPSRRAQATQNRPPNNARQLLRARRSPHSTQKFGRYTVGDSKINAANYIRLAMRAIGT